jgi:hypothetical protein
LGGSKDYRELLDLRKHFLEICQDYWCHATIAARRGRLRKGSRYNSVCFQLFTGDGKERRRGRDIPTADKIELAAAAHPEVEKQARTLKTRHKLAK